MKWDHQVAQAINKSKRALHGKRLIRHHFNKHELKQLLTSNFYSILYFNSKVWHLSSLNSNLKKKLLATSSLALKLLEGNFTNRISYDRLHRISGRATPNSMLSFKLSIQLYKNFNDKKPL